MCLGQTPPRVTAVKAVAQQDGSYAAQSQLALDCTFSWSSQLEGGRRRRRALRPACFWLLLQLLAAASRRLLPRCGGRLTSAACPAPRHVPVQ